MVERHPVESMRMGRGSYGLYPRNRDDETMLVWFCGGLRGGPRDDNHPCAHSTRRAARECPRRPKREER